MSGLLSLARYRALVPDSELSDAVAQQALNAAQAIAESLSGLRFGSEVESTNLESGTTYRIVYHGGLFEPGQRVRLVGGGVDSEPFEVTEAGQGWLEVQSDVAIEPSRIMPIIEYVGSAASGYVYCQPKPLFSVLSVTCRLQPGALWQATDQVRLLLPTQYEVFEDRGFRLGVQVQQSALPLISDSGQYLVKRAVRQPIDSVKVVYAAGFYSQVPADLESAALQLVASITSAWATGGVFASESLDYYSYSNLSYDQMSALPHSAVSTLYRYGRM